MLGKEIADDILARYTGDLAPTSRYALLMETVTVRVVEGQPVELYNPYAAAVRFLLTPDTLKARTDGSVSETYVDLPLILEYLRGESAALMLSWPIEDPIEGAGGINVDLDLRGWGT